jgi:predicted ATPase/DNA-binding CsgD family transcriptional regulator
VTRPDRQRVAGNAARIWAPLTSFVGRASDVAELTSLLDDGRLVTVTGPGGVGKTRLAIEVALAAADRFPDGVWLVELGRVADEAQVPDEVASSLGVQQDPARPALEVLTEALEQRRLLLVLDNCEHLLSATAELCRALLKSADELCILATSREQLGVDDEMRYQLSPLGLPASDAPAEVAGSAAAALFAERARRAGHRLALSPQDAPLVAHVVTQLDGMPLAIELAAARVEALGMAGLAERIDDALRLLAGTDRLVAARHRSLAAVADWSYQLLTEPEQRVFRRLAMFPGPFTLAAAEAIAGPDAAEVVMRLADCSLLVPPRLGPDRRSRYSMLQTLRAYALDRLREVGEEQEVMASLTGFALSVAEEAAAGCETSHRELAALHWLDAEDATLNRASGWALDHDAESALRLATAQARWLRVRGRLAEARERLSGAVARSPADSKAWASAQVWLGILLSSSASPADSLGRLAAVVGAHAGQPPSRPLVEALICQAVMRLNLGDDPADAADDAHRALALARDLGFAAGELQALAALSLTAFYADDAPGVLDWAQRAEALLPSASPDDPSDIAGDMSRWSHYIVATVLTETGNLDAARRVCAAGLTLSRRVDDLLHLVSLLMIKAKLERQAGNFGDAGACLREAADIAARIGDHINLTNIIDECAKLCAEAGRGADAVTLWAAHAADLRRRGLPAEPAPDRERTEYMRRIEAALTPGQVRAAQERGERMAIPAAAELAVLVTTRAREERGEPAPGTVLSPRERELVALVAAGHTNAEIAAELVISVRTVSSHLDRIRDKTGYRRRADLTRLALEEHLI